MLTIWFSAAVAQLEIHPTVTTNASEDTMFIVILLIRKDALK
jgi:hypothetical protein